MQAAAARVGLAKPTIVRKTMKNEGGIDFKEADSLNRGRFVLLHHQFETHSSQQAHWDLMLEKRESLLTFQLLALPTGSQIDLEPRLRAKRIADHRLVYLDYEGPISGNRGSVSQVAAGMYRTSNRAENSLIRLELAAKQLHALIEFREVQPEETTELQILEWRLR